MKKYVFGLMMAMISTSALADQSISLSAGSKIRLNAGQATVVSCEGQQNGGVESASRCKLENSSGIYFNILVDGKYVQMNVSGMETAIGIIRKMRDAGLCN